MSELLSSQRLHSINTQRFIITHYAKKIAMFHGSW